MTVKSDSNAHLPLSSTPTGTGSPACSHLSMASKYSLKQIHPSAPQFEHDQEPFHTSMLLCVYTFHTDKSLLFLLLGFCLTCVFMSSPFSTSEVMISDPASPDKAVEWSLPSNPTTGRLKGAQYLLETQNVVGIQSSVEFATASPSDKYRGACLSPNDEGGLTHSQLI